MQQLGSSSVSLDFNRKLRSMQTKNSPCTFRPATRNMPLRPLPPSPPVSFHLYLFFFFVCCFLLSLPPTFSYSSATSNDDQQKRIKAFFQWTGKAEGERNGEKERESGNGTRVGEHDWTETEKQKKEADTLTGNGNLGS